MITPTANQWQNVQPIRFNGDVLELLDQRILPHQEIYLSYDDPINVANAITDMVVRGAPAIGITAAFGIVLAAQQQLKQNVLELKLEDAFDALSKSRPTAVNLFWALDQMKEILTNTSHMNIQQQVHSLCLHAEKILQDDIAANMTMGNLGASLIDEDSQVYTHCNAGALATGGYGTALGVIRSGFAQQRISQVYAGETRPCYKVLA